MNRSIEITGKPSFYGAHFDEEENLFLSKIGSIKIFLHRPIDGAIRQVVIKRKGRRWFAIFRQLRKYKYFLTA